jgi:hypothetical protein
MKEKKLDLFVVIILQLLGILYAVLTRDLFIGRSLFFAMAFILPAVVYMGLREKKNWKKILFATLVFGLLYGLALSFFAEATGSWRTNDYIFNYRIFGLVAFEDILGQFLMALNIFVFYEHFVDHEDWKMKKLSKYAALLGLLGLIFLLAIYTVKPNLYDILPYPYMMIGSVAIIPTVFILISNPRMLKKLLPMSAYFFFLWFATMLFALTYDYWWYPGERFIGTVNILDITFPFEELFFWMLLYAPTIVAYYELTFDDNK